MSKHNERAAVAVLNKVRQANIILKSIDFCDIEDMNNSSIDGNILNATIELNKAIESLNKIIKF